MITEVVVPVVETPEKTPLEGFAIVSEPLQVQHADNFLFMKDSYEIHQPISDALAPLVEQARVHFAENPFKVLEIIGLYSKEEPNPSLFPTIGLARANAVKSYLEKKGFPSQQIKIADRLADADLSQTNAPVWATLFQVSQVSEDALLQEKEKLEAFAAELRKNPIRLYFETGEAHINLNEEERNRVAQLNNYVTQVSDAKVLVVGHTDNVGKRTSNVRLGQERADFVKLYLQKNNFDEAVLEATSQGPDKPIASNKTQEGRAENRRVEITLK
ncbi:OmpA family protein [Capnocytophaga sp.]|uniref:OmpA family protein n=1 Tax=Capnocytophaga sp. TaxID=44737 RepID=UPI0026DAFC3E|nr:OmpA family protein [Capnocytophaga sp.]